MGKPIRWHCMGGAALLAVSIAACGGGGSGSAPSTVTVPPATPVTTVIAQPLTLNLYPNQPAGGVPLLSLMATAVGSVPVNMPLGFDTGSAGVTLNALSIFPSSMVSSAGFVFPAGATTLSYNGITVTNLQGTRSYGTLTRTVEYGNLGFAQLTLGDAQGTVTTELMPVFLFYSVDDPSGGAFTAPQWQGWFGVSATADAIEVGGAAPGNASVGCTPQSSTTCYTVSGMKFIDYGPSVDAGFLLNPAPIQTCSVAASGSCSAAPMLTIGLTAGLESAFSTMDLVCPPNGYIGPPQIAGYPVCQQNVANLTFTATGASSGTFTGYATFDTGTPYMYFSTPAGSTFPSVVEPGSNIAISTTSGFSYAYVADADRTSQTVVDSGAGGNSIVGLQYFTTNSWMIDFTAGLEGWK
jgi:hypothetical protein